MPQHLSLSRSPHPTPAEGDPASSGNGAQAAQPLAAGCHSPPGRNLCEILVVVVDREGGFMSNYRSNVRAHGLEPTVDWRARFVLSAFLSVAICAAMVVLR